MLVVTGALANRHGWALTVRMVLVLVARLTVPSETQLVPSWEVSIPMTPAVTVPVTRMAMVMLLLDAPKSTEVPVPVVAAVRLVVAVAVPDAVATDVPLRGLVTATFWVPLGGGVAVPVTGRVVPGGDIPSTLIRFSAIRVGSFG